MSRNWSAKATCLALLLIVPGTALGDNLMGDGFDGYSTGAPPVPPWTDGYALYGGPEISRAEAAGMGVTITIDDTVHYGASGKSLHLLDYSTGTSHGANGISSRVSRTFSPASSVVMEYYMRTHNGAYEGAFVNLDGDVGADWTAVFSNGVYGGQAGYIGIHGSPAGWVKPDLLPYTEDTWYYVRREMDLATNTGRFYVAEAGNPANSASYSIGRNYANTYFDKVWVHTSGSQGADAHIDSISITEVVDVVGDLNGDGNADNMDITPFTFALTYAEAVFEAMYPDGKYWAGDLNEDGNVDNLDVTPFVNLLLGGGQAIPEPAALSLLAFAGLVPILSGIRRWRASCPTVHR